MITGNHNEACRLAVADEAALHAALGEADVVPMLLVIAYLTHDLGLLEEAAPHIAGGWNYQESIPAGLRERIRARLAEVLREQAAQPGLPAPALPDEPTLLRMLSASVGMPVPAEYLPMVVDELRLGSTDTRALPQPLPAVGRAGDDDALVVIVGAGFGGICAAYRLKQAGIPFLLLERNARPGGTWYESQYPGCGVDTPSHFYSFSFAPNNDWSRYFCLRDEIWAYLEQVVERFGLAEHIRYQTQVVSATYQEHDGSWAVVCQDAAGTRQLRATTLITAVGHNIPSIPRLPGLEDFEGPVLHTGQWDHEVPLRDRRVALVGTGASGMQVGPAIIDQVRKLTVFQRTPHWAMGNPNYHREVSPGQRWALNHIPYFSEWHRFLIFWASSDLAHGNLQVDPDWHSPGLSLNAENHRLRETIIAYMRQELGGDENLLARCTPAYPPYGKRLLRDNHWFRMLRRDDVELVSEGIERVTRDGIVTRSGEHHPADVLIMATGYDAHKLLWPMEIVGRQGRSIRDVWGDDDPKAFKGVSVPGFPNLFVLAGPNTVLSHGGSAVFQLECQVQYVMQAIGYRLEGGLRSLEVRQDAHDAYNDVVERRHDRMVWKHPGVTSWYKNRHDRITMTSPWRLVDFWNLTRQFEPADYRCEAGAAALARPGRITVDRVA